MYKVDPIKQLTSPYFLFFPSPFLYLLWCLLLQKVFSNPTLLMSGNLTWRLPLRGSWGGKEECNLSHKSACSVVVDGVGLTVGIFISIRTWLKNIFLLGLNWKNITFFRTYGTVIPKKKHVPLISFTVSFKRYFIKFKYIVCEKNMYKV